MADPQLCVTVTGATMGAVRRARDAASEHADMVEVRLDTVDRPDAVGALEGRRRPVLVTCRAAWEGGHFSGSEEERRRILEAAAAAGAEFVDVEAAAVFAADIIRARRGRGVVVSHHHFGGAAGNLAARYAGLRSTGGEIVKLSVETPRLTDSLSLFGISSGQAGDHVLVGMGPAGVPTRLLAARLGNRWTYAGDGVAPGQIPLQRMLRDFRFRRIRPDAAIYGVVGRPVMHSRSPVMHNAGFAALGLNAVYLPLEAADADDFVEFARKIGLRGASITAPYKVVLMRYVDEVDAVAERVGAINTLIVRDGRWIGANTDVEGFLTPLAGRIALRGIRATVLGAGGAARAVAVALADQGTHVTICARQPEAAAEVARRSGASAGPWPPRPGTWDVLVNATPSGSDGVGNPVPDLRLDGEIVFDLVYAPAETPLLAAARAAGCLTIGGLEMLMAQAERQFQLWTGQRPPAGLFQSAAGYSPAARGA